MTKRGTKFGFIALALAIATFLLWFNQARLVALPEDRTWWVLSFLTAAGLGVFALLRGTRWFGAIPAVLAIVIGLFLPMTVYISPQQVGVNAIQVGDTIPQFRQLDEHGQPFDSETLHGHLVLIKFFRAHW